MKSILAVIITLILCTNAAARVEDKRWIRQETTYVVEEILIEKEELPELFSTMTILKIIPGIDLSEFTDLDVLYQPYIIEPEEDEYRGETLHEIVEKIAHKNMRDIDKWFLKEEVKFLNRNEIYGDLTFDPNVELRVPKYSPLLHRGKCCSDMRNMMVAVMKGEQYNVHWAYMIGVRTHENPEKKRDHFAYGVVTKKGTNLWTQADWGARTLKRWTRNAHNPSYNDILKASGMYVNGKHNQPSSTWARAVYAVMKRCQGK